MSEWKAYCNGWTHVVSNIVLSNPPKQQHTHTHTTRKGGGDLRELLSLCGSLTYISDVIQTRRCDPWLHE